MPTPGPRVADAEISAWHVRVAAGETLGEISADTGRDARTIRHHLRRIGVDVEPANPRLGRHLGAEERQRIVDRYVAGETVSEICRSGHASATVRRALDRAGVRCHD